MILNFQTLIVIITGGSASGKTTLMQFLSQIFEIQTMMSIVSRLPRVSDPVGDYEHDTYRNIWKAFLRGELVAHPSPLAGNLYGMYKHRLEEALEAGGLYVRSLTPNVLGEWNEVAGKNILFVHLQTPPNDVAEFRMLERGDSIEQIRKKLLEEASWDKMIEKYIASGMKINIVPEGTVDETLAYIVQLMLQEMKRLNMQINLIRQKGETSCKI